jgi:site-specific recombinase XerD
MRQRPRIHKGYGRLPIQDIIPLHIDQWLNAHKDWKGCRRTRIQAVKRAINYAVEKGLITKNPIRGYKTPKANSRVTYITSEQEQSLLKAANRALRIAIKVCIRTGARYYSEFCKLTRQHVKDHGDRMEWVFQPHESKTRKLRTIRIADPEILGIVREEMKTNPILFGT